MNVRRWLLLSLALNVALGVLMAWASFARPRGNAPFSVTQHLTNRTLRVRQIVRESAPAVVEVNAPFHWSEVESTDYRVYMQNLRAIGCPEQTVRDLIVADVDELFIERLRQLLAPLHREFWRLLAELKEVEDEAQHYEKAWEALKEERAGVFKALLGREDPFEADAEEGRTAEQRARWAHVLDFLPAEKRDRVASVRDDCDGAVHKLWESDHPLAKAEREERQQKQRGLEADRDRQLAELLTPAELAEYHLRTSPGGDVVRRLTRVEFAGDELTAIARATTEQQQAEAKLGQNTPEAKRQREALAQRTDAELKATLGEARFADYQRASDGRFEAISAVVERHGLPEEKATVVYDVLRQADAQARQLRDDPSRTAEDRTALLRAVRDETERTVATELGARALATYRERGGENWLNQLVAPPKP